MRLLDVPARKAWVLPSQARFLEEELVRGRLPEVRPSALERRGEPALSPPGSMLHDVPDAHRFCVLCASMGCEHARVKAQLSRIESRIPSGGNL